MTKTCATPGCKAFLRASNVYGFCRKHRTHSADYRAKKAVLGTKYWQANPDRQRNHALKHRYGITLEQKAEMYAAQDGKCAICDRGINFIKAHTDHNHETGRVRGLLCASCNVAIGLLADDPDRIARVFVYLASEP